MFSDVSDISADVFLKLFGEHFFSFCKHAGYDTMLKTLGGNLVEFIGNLDALHSYLALSYQVCVCVISFQFGSTANRHIFSTAVYYILSTQCAYGKCLWQAHQCFVLHICLKLEALVLVFLMYYLL